VATALAVYKPPGMTSYGRRKAKAWESRDGVGPGRASVTSTRWGLYVLYGMIGLILLFIVVHLAGGGLRGH
jgi:hypothetical protein